MREDGSVQRVPYLSTRTRVLFGGIEQRRVAFFVDTVDLSAIVQAASCNDLDKG